MRANDKRYSGRSNKSDYGKALAIGQRSLRTSKFRSMGLKKTHFNGAEYTECQYLEKFRSVSSAFPQIRISWDSSLSLFSQAPISILANDVTTFWS